MKSMIIGLTGPIASGKNAVARMFSRRTSVIIDADRIGHQVMVPQTRVWHEIVKAFGSRVLNRGGAVNRRKLASAAFSSPSALNKLNRITHPEIKKIIIGMVRGSKLAKKEFIVINAAVLEKMKLLPLVDKVIVVLADEKKRMGRLRRSGLSRADAAARIRSQEKDPAYRKTADFVIMNKGTINDLKKKVKRIISSL